MSRSSRSKNSNVKDPRKEIQSLGIQMRECCNFIPVAESELSTCGCGKPRKQHFKSSLKKGEPSTSGTWHILNNTEKSPTDAFGTLDFRGGFHSERAQFLRLSFDTDPAQILNVLQDIWNLAPPKMIISVSGGIANFSLERRVVQFFHSGLWDAVKATEAWIITSGLNSGVVRHVSSAVAKASEQRSTKGLVLIGIAPWGMVSHREELRRRVGTVFYRGRTASANTRFGVLDQRHNFFLLADNGTTGRYGAEMILRQKLEQHLVNLRHPDNKKRHVSVVSVCLDGGFSTVCNLWSNVHCNPSIPVMIFGKSERIPSILWAAAQSKRLSVRLRDRLNSELQEILEREFKMRRSRVAIATKILDGFSEKKEFVIFASRPWNFEYRLLSAILRQAEVSREDALFLTASWNRADIARSDVFLVGHEWAEEALETALERALQDDRVEFVKLLLSEGVCMQTFLTIERLERLYQNECGPDAANTLWFVVDDVMSWHRKVNEGVSLIYIGSVIELLMGPGYNSYYRDRCFQAKYSKRKNFSEEGKSGRRHAATDFDFPFSDLMIWAVLTNKSVEMIKYLWTRDGDAMAKGLVALKLYSALAKDALDDDVVHDMAPGYQRKAELFAALTLELLEICWHSDAKKTRELLSYELVFWNQETCISLAARANHQAFIAHSSIQTILLDLWKGGLNMRRYTNFYVIAGCICFPIIPCLAFKTRNQLEAQPTTDVEYQGDHETENDNGPDDAELSDSMQSLSSTDEDNTQPDVEAAVNEETDLGSDKPLSCGTKFYEFYNAPITIFWGNVISYLIFLGIFAYVVLMKMTEEPEALEIFLAVYVASIGLDLFRKLFMAPSSSFRSKCNLFGLDKWNVVSLVSVGVFVVAFSMRMVPREWEGVREWGRVLLCVCAGFWYIRLYSYLSVNPTLGVYINMLWKMIKCLMGLVGLTTVLLIAFGLVRQSILFPKEEKWDWILLRNVFYQPYFMLYGEVYAGQIDVCGDNITDPTLPSCVHGVFIVVIFMAAFLLVANIVMIGSLLIAVFNNIYSRVNEGASQLWKFQRYDNVLEYQAMPVFPPPFIVIGDIYQSFLHVYNVYKEKKPPNFAFKLFLDNARVEEIHVFEEECLETLQRIKDSAEDNRKQKSVEFVLNRLDEIATTITSVADKVGSAVEKLGGKQSFSSLMEDDTQ